MVQYLGVFHRVGFFSPSGPETAPTTWVIGWQLWPAVDGQVYFGTILLSILGAAVVLFFWTCVAYGNRSRVG